MKRGEIWWANLPEPEGSGPGFRRPVLVLQANEFNISLIKTTIIAILSSNLHLAKAPGNVSLSKKEIKLRKDSVINVSQILTLDKRLLTERICTLSSQIMEEVDIGIKLILAIKN